MKACRERDSTAAWEVADNTGNLGDSDMRALARICIACCLTLAHGLSFGTTAENEGPRLYVNEMLVGTFHTTTAANRVAGALKTVRTGSSIKVLAKRKSARLLISGREVLVISRSVAKSLGTTPGDLANSWAGRIRQAIALPPLKLDRSLVVLGGSGVAKLSLLGSGVKSAKIESSDESVAVTSQVRGQLLVKARGLGSANVVLSAGGYVQTIAVRVLPQAANFPQAITATVTGFPATNDIVQGAVLSAINNRLRTVAEAELKLAQFRAKALGPSASTTIPVMVRASAPDSLPSVGIVNVTVRNEPVGKQLEGELWYCNDPESVKTPGLLFTAQLNQNSPARMLYHHYNASGAGLFIDVQAINESDEPARIVLIPGEGAPDKNPVLVGAEAAEQFYRNYLWGSGEILTVPPHSTMLLAFRRLAPQETMSGLCYLRLLEGGTDQLTVVAAAKRPFGLDNRWTVAMNSATPWRYIGPQRISGLTPKVSIYSDHVYPNPFQAQEFTYTIGGRHPFIRIGENAIPRLDKLSQLSGNFGVTYTIKANLENPFNQAVDLDMVFEASAGYSGALFIVNGEIRRTPLIQPKSEVAFGRVRLEGGMSRSLTFTTIPLSGSSYPATITFRPVEGALTAAIKKMGLQ